MVGLQQIAGPSGTPQPGRIGCIIIRKRSRPKQVPEDDSGLIPTLECLNVSSFKSKPTGRNPAAEGNFSRTQTSEIPPRTRIAGIGSMEMKSAINLTVCSVTTVLSL